MFEGFEYFWQRTNRISLLGFAWVFGFLGGCDAPQKTAAPGLREVSSMSLYFGREGSGFVDWFSLDGRWALVYEIVGDTDGDGVLDLRLGQHGEVDGDRLVPVLYDLRTAITGERLDEVVGREPTRTRLLVRSEGTLRILEPNAKGLQSIPGPDLDDRSDSNPCLSPRQASLDPMFAREPRGAACAWDAPGEVRWDPTPGRPRTRWGWLVSSCSDLRCGSQIVCFQGLRPGFKRD